MGLWPGQPCKADNTGYNNVNDYGVSTLVKKAFFCIQKYRFRRAIEVPGGFPKR
jgi:hypothetical protein